MANTFLLRRFPFSLPLAALIPLGMVLLKVAGLEGVTTPFLLSLAGIMLASWFGGYVTGLLASLLSLYILPTIFSGFNPTALDPHGYIRLSSFFIECNVVALVTSLAASRQENFKVQARRQRTLVELSQLALGIRGETTGLQKLFDQTLKLCAQDMGTPRAALLQHGINPIEPDEVFFHVRAWQGVGETAFPNRLEDRPESHAGYVFRAGAPVVSDDLKSESRFQNDEITGQMTRSVLSVPVGPVEAPWGVLSFGSPTPRKWRQDEIDFAQTAANALAVAIERHDAREAIVEGELRYRAFLEQTDEAVWRFEFDEPLAIAQSPDRILEHAGEFGFLAECNDAFARLYGYETASEMVGMRLWQLFSDEADSNYEFLRALIKANFKLSNAESVEVDREGKAHIFLNNVVGIIEDGILTRLWGTQRDITEQRQAEEELSGSEQRFRALFEASPIAIAILREGKALYANKAVGQMLGFQSGQELLGRHTSEFVPLENKEFITDRITRRELGEDEPTSYEIQASRQDGSHFPARIQVAPLKLPDGPATIVFGFDLTQDKRVEAEIAGLLRREQRAAIRATRLQEIAFALTKPLSAEEVARVTLDGAIQTLGAKIGNLTVAESHWNPVGRDDGDEEHLMTVYAGHVPTELANQSRRFPISTPFPSAAVFRTGKAMWVRNVEDIKHEFPVFDAVESLHKTRSVASVPLQVQGRLVGVLSLTFDQPQTFDEDQRAFLLTLSSQCAQSLERARLDTERRELTRQQQEALALLNTLLDLAPVGFALFDRQGRYVLANETLARINGFPLGEHRGKTPHEILPTLGSTLERTIEQVWHSGEPSGEIDLVLTTPNDTHYCLAAFYPVKVTASADSETLGVGAVIIDITERVRVERERTTLFNQLEVERARFEAILQQMPSAVVIGEAPSGRLILSNPQVERVLGREFFRPSDPTHHQEYRGFHPDGRELQPSEWPLSRAINGGEVIEGEEIIVPRNDGHIAVIRVNAAPIRDRDNNITAAVAVFDDVTLRARQDSGQRFLAEAGSSLISTLNEQIAHERLAQLCVPRVADWCLVAVPDSEGLLRQVAIASTNNSGSTLAQRFKQQLTIDSQLPWDIAGVLEGRKAKLYVDHPIEQLKQQEASAAYIGILREMGARSAIVAPLAARGRVFGVMIWLTAESERLYDQTDLELAEELARRAGLTIDNARLLQEAQLARDEAQNANRAKDEFLAVVSHELRTPLTPILGWLELLRSPGADENLRKQAYDVIERNANAQAQLVNDILDVSRITAGKLRLELKGHDLAFVVRQAVDALRMAIIEKQLQLETAIEEVGDACIDVNRMQQVVWNLLQNAIKFTPVGGTIRIELKPANSREAAAQLNIIDSGQGIEPQFLPHVFDRFRQADSSSTRKAGGLGLGLAIVNHIVEMHGGSARAYSAGLGQGSTFSIEIPLLVPEAAPIPPAVVTPEAVTVSPPEEASAAEQTPLRPLAPTAALQGLRVLVVDDEADTREMLARLLESAGAGVRVAPAATSALEMMAEFGPDLVISDIGMPEMDGYALRRRLKERWNDIPAIALTAYASPSDAQKANEAGFERFLTKPVSARQLLDTVTDLLHPQSAS